MVRWLKFNAVGCLGVIVQLTVLGQLVGLGLNYLVATALAVETAVLHNYLWHTSWTWKERHVNRLESFCRFQCANGLVSIVSNVILMRLFAGWAGLPALPANLLAIVCASLLNFWLSERWVFVTSAHCGRRGRWS